MDFKVECNVEGWEILANKTLDSKTGVLLTPPTNSGLSTRSLNMK